MDAVIIAGGRGQRLEDPIAKAMTIVKGKRLIDFQINYLLKNGIKKIILALGFKAEDVIEHVKSAYPNAQIDYTIEKTLLGTAGGLKLALQKSDADHVVAFNCDDVTDIDIKKLSKIGENTVCVAHPQLQFGQITEKNSYAVFEEKPKLDIWVSCGWYFFNRKEIMKHLPDKGMLEYDVFPKIKLRVFKHEGFWMTINNKKEISEFEKAELPDTLRI
jgi:NDP-sugar pyrophosphorylase family protein